MKTPGTPGAILAGTCHGLFGGLAAQGINQVADLIKPVAEEPARIARITQ